LGRSTNKNRRVFQENPSNCWKFHQTTRQTFKPAAKKPVKLLGVPPKNPSNFWGFRQKTRQTLWLGKKKAVKLISWKKKAVKHLSFEKKAVKLVSLIQKKPSNCEVPPRMVNCDCLFKNPVAI
jgi:hypothetical protein